MMRPVDLVMALSIAALAVGSVNATELAAAPPSRTVTSLTPATGALHGAQVGVADFGLPVGNGALEKLSGGSDVSNDMTLNGNVSNNSTDNTETGLNSIASGAFSGAAGLPMVIQNSGNGVLIQNATIINVQFKP